MPINPFVEAEAYREVCRLYNQSLGSNLASKQKTHREAREVGRVLDTGITYIGIMATEKLLDLMPEIVRQHRHISEDELYKVREIALPSSEREVVSSVLALHIAAIGLDATLFGQIDGISVIASPDVDYLQVYDQYTESKTLQESLGAFE